MKSYSWIALALLMSGCLETTGTATTIDLNIAGTAITEPFEATDGAIISLTRADVAFGPLYLCAGFTAGDLCESALAEFTDAVVVDALNPAPQPIGQMNAVTGTANSYMYDLGIVSLLTQQRPLVTAAAQELSGNSVVLEGTATVDATTIPFTIAIPVQQTTDTEQGVPNIRSNTADRFTAEIRAEGNQIQITFDPRTWFQSVRFTRLLQDLTCENNASMTVCAGSVEQTCDAAGQVSMSRDCSSEGGFCMSNVGCTTQADLDIETAQGNAVRIDVTSGTRPQFTSIE